MGKASQKLDNLISTMKSEFDENELAKAAIQNSSEETEENEDDMPETPIKAELLEIPEFVELLQKTQQLAQVMALAGLAVSVAQASDKEVPDNIVAKVFELQDKMLDLITQIQGYDKDFPQHIVDKTKNFGTGLGLTRPTLN